MRRIQHNMLQHIERQFLAGVLFSLLAFQGCAAYPAAYRAAPELSPPGSDSEALARALRNVDLAGGEALLEEAKRKQAVRAAVFPQYQEALQTAKSLEAGGDLRAALEQYTIALAKAKVAHEPDESLRNDIIVLTKKLRPPPAISEEARRHAIRAQTLMESAKQDYEFPQAAYEFELALDLAPWWADVYYNQALAYEAAGNPVGALRDYRLYLLAEPNSPDQAKIRDRIYALEVKVEQIQKQERWTGLWQGESGSLYRASFENPFDFRMVMVEPSSDMGRKGWQRGDLRFEGILNGDLIKGRTATKPCQEATNPRNCIQCFGETWWGPGSMALGADGKTLTETFEFTEIRFNLSTCVVSNKTLHIHTSTYTKFSSE